MPDHNTIRTGNRSDLLYDPGRFIQNSMGDLRNDTGNNPGPWNSGSDLRNGFSQIFLQKVQLMIFGGVVAICALTMKMDLLGYDSYFPAYDNLQGVVVNVCNLSYTEQLCNVEKKKTESIRSGILLPQTIVLVCWISR